MTTRTLGSGAYSERLVKGHLVGIERLEPQRWRVTVDGHRLFTFCSESRARQAGTLEAGRLAFIAAGALLCEAPASDPCPDGPDPRNAPSPVASRRRGRS